MEEEKPMIETSDGKVVFLKTETEQKAYIAKEKAKLEDQLKRGEIDGIEYNKRIVALTVPDEYKFRTKESKKNYYLFYLCMLIPIVICLILGSIYLNWRGWFQNTLTASDIGKVISIDGYKSVDPNSIDLPTLSSEEKPVQINLDARGEDGEYKGRPLNLRYRAKYDITAIVTSVYDYYGYDDYAALVPRDVCLAWGDLGKNYLEGKVEFEQNERKCSVKVPEELDYLLNTRQSIYGKESTIATMSNNHIISSTVEIRDKVLSLKPREKIRMTGFLVDIIYGTAHPTFHMMTSLSRDDSGDGACEIFYVTSIETLKLDAV